MEGMWSISLVFKGNLKTFVRSKSGWPIPSNHQNKTLNLISYSFKSTLLVKPLVSYYNYFPSTWTNTNQQTICLFPWNTNFELDSQSGNKNLFFSKLIIKGTPPFPDVSMRLIFCFSCFFNSLFLSCQDFRFESKIVSRDSIPKISWKSFRWSAWICSYKIVCVTWNVDPMNSWHSLTGLFYYILIFLSYYTIWKQLIWLVLVLSQHKRYKLLPTDFNPSIIHISLTPDIYAFMACPVTRYSTSCSSILFTKIYFVFQSDYKKRKSLFQE